ncbi:MAG: hypothetical protein EPN39_13005 [Chitinophagaceae bacterium]|nr:MAG: hypothetical protein EPN39_13005 [Chitinophagaceae bacterium]
MKKSDFNINIDKCSLLFFNSLSEKSKRLYAGLESMKLGYDGVDEIAEKYSIHKHTVRRGKKGTIIRGLIANRAS